jgi:two-component system, NarL family, sensor histidine kinase UhpB
MKPYLFSPLSIRQRITVFTCVLLLSIILVFGLISSIGVRRAALKVGQDRLQSLTEQLSTMLSGNSKNFISTTFTAANKPAIKSYLLSGGKDSSMEVTKILGDLRKDTSNVEVELRNSAYAEILRSAKDGSDIKINVDTVLSGLSGHAKPDSGKVGKLYILDSFVYYPIMVTVIENNIENNKPIGYVVRWRKMTATAKSVEQLTQLLGTDARLFIGNTDGSVWTDMRLAVPGPATNEKDGVTEYSREKKRVLAYFRPIGNSQWVVAVELSKNKILEAANRFLYWLIIAGSLILAIGILIAWFTSRRLSEPLRKLTAAATAIASGNHSTQVQVNRRDELGKLARAFNAMEIQVEKSQKALEEKAENYKLLFENNPMPMWIISRDTLNVLDVNKSAINHYGYTREEFLKLNAVDLRPKEDIEKYLKWVRTRAHESDYAGVWRHKKKDGGLIKVDVIAQDILYQGLQARLVLSNDVTEKLKAEAELIKYRVEQQRIITEITIQAQEKEREEIGKELHDNINQLLAAAKMSLELGLKRENDTELFLKSIQNINLAIREIRQLSQTLVAPSLADIALPDAIKEMVDNMSLTSLMKVKMNIKNYDENKIEDDMKLMFYRIVQEQLNNIVKHARAKNVSIELTTTSVDTILIVKDDGVGFDTTKARKGIGLRNISSRVKFYNGSAEILSAPGEGTRVEVRLPLEV